MKTIFDTEKHKEEFIYPKAFIIPQDKIIGKYKISIFNTTSKATITDYAILCGGLASDFYYTINENFSLKNRAGQYWIEPEAYISETGNNNHVNNIDYWGNKDRLNGIGVRPAFKYSEIKKYSKNERVNESGILEVECGLFPKSVIDDKLETKFKSEFKNKETIEYNGDTYVKVKLRPFFGICKLTNENYYTTGESTWIKKEPLILLIDKEKDIAITKEIVTAGVAYNKFDDYLNNVFVKEMFSKEAKQIQMQNKQKEADKNQNDKNLVNSKKVCKTLKEIKKMLLSTYSDKNTATSKKRLISK